MGLSQLGLPSASSRVSVGMGSVTADHLLHVFNWHVVYESSPLFVPLLNLLRFHMGHFASFKSFPYAGQVSF